MRVLVVDSEAMALPFVMRATDAGHDVKWCPYVAPGKSDRAGEGMNGIKRIDDWETATGWVGKDGLIINTGNWRYTHRLEYYRELGYRIFGPTVKSAELEIKRGVGMKAMEAVGIPVPPYETFNSLEDAAKFARKSSECWVLKVAGDESNKDMTFVAHDPAEMVGWIQRKIKAGVTLKGPCFMQEKIDLLSEFGVSGFVGPEGFLPAKWGENIEHKRLHSGEIGPQCFTADSEILTRNGWKFWPDVTLDDEVCTLKDGEITYERPISLTVGEFTGDLIGWQSSTVDILVTPGHKMYVQDDHRRNPFYFEPAYEAIAHKRTILRGRGGEWNGADQTSLLPSFYRGGMEQWAALLGAYIADGNTKAKSVVFGNCPAHKAEAFIGLASSAGFSAKMYGRDLYINGTKLSAYLSDFGTAAEKYVPQYIKDSPVSVIEAFLYGYGLGDGSRRPTNLIYTTVSRRLADDLQELALKAGLATTVNTRDRRGESHEINGYTCVNRLIAYDISVAQEKYRAEISPEIAYRQAHDGMVYCVTVSSHIIFTRRNGKCCWIGQTGEQGNVQVWAEASRIADECLKPMEPVLVALGHRGDFAVGLGIDQKGNPWAMEFTARFGYPAWYQQIASIKGDPVQWMSDLMDGKDTLKVNRGATIAVVLSQPMYPYGKSPPDMVEGNPISGVDDHMDDLHFCSVMVGRGPQMIDGKIKDAPQFQTTGELVMVATSVAPTVSKAMDKVYAICKEVKFPGKSYRDDVGEKVLACLPKLAKFGIATEWAA